MDYAKTDCRILLGSNGAQPQGCAPATLAATISEAEARISGKKKFRNKFIISNDATFWFKKGVYGCINANSLVLLDTKSGNYFFIDGVELSAILRWVKVELDIDPVFKNRLPHIDNDIEIIEKFEEAGLVTKNPLKGQILSPPQVYRPDSPFEYAHISPYREIKWHNWLSSILCSIASLLIIKIFSINTILKIIKNKKTRDNTDHCCLSKAQILSAMYRAMRPILIQNRVCLFDSITFLLFCRIYGVFPNLVFGVSARPFEAHCWVQLGHHILNDAPQRTNMYTPIMKI